MSAIGPVRRRDVLTGASVALLAAATGDSVAQSVAGAPQPAIPTGRLQVAIIVDDGANMIDLAGAWEVFQDTRVEKGRKGDRAFYLYAVAPERKILQTTGNGGSGLPFLPHHSLDDAPAPDIIVMGAQSRADHPAKIAWIQQHAPQAKVVMSVCTGAFLLARTGLLDGKRATTHHEYFDGFAELFPKVELVRGRRFVDNGKFITAGGLTSGIDSALHVVARLLGEEQAQATANYMEYGSDAWRTGAVA